MHVQPLLAILFLSVTTLHSPLLAGSMSESFLKWHRDSRITLNVIAEGLSKQAQIPLDMAKDVVNAYTLAFIQFAVKASGEKFFPNHYQARKYVLNAFGLHQAAYWLFSLVRYISERPAEFIVHSVIYGALVNVFGIYPPALYEMGQGNRGGTGLDSAIDDGAKNLKAAIKQLTGKK